jgi:hypothetical protein
MPLSPGVPDRPEPSARTSQGELEFSTLLYRFLFFDWLFRDVSRAVNRYERLSAWQHNRAMRRYLPVYLRRWSVCAALAFGLGCVFESVLQGETMAAWFFAWACVALTGVLVISVLWIFLSREQAL